MTNCKSFIDRLALMALDELEENEIKQVNQHLAECTSCADDFKKLQEVTSTLGYGPDDDITEVEKLQIENAVYRQLARSRAPSQRLSWTSVTLRLAAAVVLIALGYFSGTLSSEPQPLQLGPLSTESMLASLDWKENMAAFRLSPQGLRLIARGRESLKSN